MSTVMKASEFAKRAKNIAENYKTLYVMGCFGSPLNAANKKRYCNNHDYNRQASRQKLINAASEDTFGFDCVCLIKGILWGWNGDKSKSYGGATYGSNGVPDIGADSMIKVCSGVSTDFSNIAVGEALWCSGHIGIYIGDGLGVECTPAWKNKVQITAVSNIGAKSGYNSRKWTKHGKLPYIEYDVEETAKPTAQPATQPAASKLAFAVGDIVNYSGNTHYTSSQSNTPKNCKGGEAKVTAVAAGAKHPYHLVNTGTGATVYGWVDANKVSKPAAAKAETKPAAATTFKTGSSNEETAFNYFTTVMKLNTAAACGILANIYHESNFNPKALGDNGTSYGICQWHNERWTRMKEWCSKNGKDSTTIEGQLYFLKYELEVYYKSVLSYIAGVPNTAQGAYDAAYYWCVHFEIPANKEQTGAKRGTYAKNTSYPKHTGSAAQTATAAAPAKASNRIDYAQEKDSKLAGTYKVTAQSGLNIRTGAGTSKASIGVLPFNSLVSNYGYFSVAADGKKWLYVKTAGGSVGFCSAEYLQKC